MRRGATRKGPKQTENLPRKVVALGGGTGMPSVLAGLRERIANGSGVDLTAVVTMSDDGGSSGRLRRTRGLPPPGDVRNCLLALSSERDLMTALFQHRYEGAEGIGGHSLGNLILAALAEQTGSFLKAVEVSSRILRTVGRILPATLDDVVLEARLADGSTIVGESTIGVCRRRIESVSLSPRNATPTPGVVDAILGADLVVLGPGSLFTSLIPNLTLQHIDDALIQTPAVRVFVGNLVSEKGEGAGLQHSDQLAIIEQHAGGAMIDALLAHDGSVPAELERRYRLEGATLLKPPTAEIPGVVTFCRKLISDGPKLRHEPSSTADAIIEAWHTVRSARKGAVDGGVSRSVKAG